MAKLIIVSKSPFRFKDSFTLISFSESGDGVLFIQDACFSLRKPPDELKSLIDSKKEEGVDFYALKPDLLSRAIETEIEAIDFDTFIDLIFKYDRVLS